MDSLPDELRGNPNPACADSWVGEDDILFVLVQNRQGSWVAFMANPRGGPVITVGPMLASNRIREAAEAKWEELHGRKVPSEYSFQEVPYVETVTI